MPEKRHKVRKARYTDYTRWVGLPHYMLRCPAWRTMSPTAKALLIELWARYNGINNGTISFGVREAADIGLNRTTASKAFHELVGRGFLRVNRDSAFTVKTRMAREWTVTALPLSDTEPAPKDFMKWTAERGLRDSEHSHAGVTDSHASVTVAAKRKNVTADGHASVTVSAISGASQSPCNDTSILPRGVRPGRARQSASPAEKARTRENFPAEAWRRWRAFPSWLKSERERRKLSPADVGREAGLDAQAIEAIEAGAASASKALRRKIVKAVLDARSAAE